MHRIHFGLHPRYHWYLHPTTLIATNQYNRLTAKFFPCFSQGAQQVYSRVTVIVPADPHGGGSDQRWEGTAQVNPDYDGHVGELTTCACDDFDCVDVVIFDCC
jgi:hypothetical protein